MRSGDANRGALTDKDHVAELYAAVARLSTPGPMDVVLSPTVLMALKQALSLAPGD